MLTEAWDVHSVMGTRDASSITYIGDTLITNILGKLSYNHYKHYILWEYSYMQKSSFTYIGEILITTKNLLLHKLGILSKKTLFLLGGNSHHKQILLPGHSCMYILWNMHQMLGSHIFQPHL